MLFGGGVTGFKRLMLLAKGVSLRVHLSQRLVYRSELLNGVRGRIALLYILWSLAM